MHVREMLQKISKVNTYSVTNPSIEQSSCIHREVSSYLGKLGLEHRNEVAIGPFSVDIYHPETTTIIEIDGPHHFFRDSVVRTSSSILKHKLLVGMGYKVEHVPYQEWLQCTSDSKKLAYCSNVVDKIRMGSD